MSENDKVRLRELTWHPATDDPAFDAGHAFVDRNIKPEAPMRWLIRQAFWCGVRWARERSVPVAGRVVDDGRIEWNAGDGP